VQESALCVDGWIPVDPLTLETAFTDVYAVGDVTSVGTPKAGVFAEGQAAVVAAAIIARGRDAGDATTYDGHGLCYIEFGDDEVAQVDVTFMAGQPPTGVFDGPSVGYATDKADFGASRAQRWFGREWTNT
jgi:sulfide:quinone oxidoreductase